MIHVHWSTEDAQFVATDDRFPSLSWLADSEGAATLGLDILMRDDDELTP